MEWTLKHYIFEEPNDDWWAVISDDFRYQNIDRPISSIMNEYIELDTELVWWEVVGFRV